MLRLIYNPNPNTGVYTWNRNTQFAESDLLTLKGAQEKEKTASELQWNWL